jgi:cobalt/nickel transport system permease protein
LHHVVLERWSRGHSILHTRDPRSKILALVSFLVVVATTTMASPLPGAAYGLLLVSVILLARLPLGSALLRAGTVLPFSVTFAAMSLLAGDAPRALALLQKSYLSALAVLLVVGTTPLPELLRGLESLGAPRFLLLVVQFLYRYLFVISEQAQHMRLAAASRGTFSRPARNRRRRLRAAAGALSVLFARSYDRAEGIHRAMLARGFQGHVSLLSLPRFRWTDAVFLLLAVLAPVALRVTLGRFI